MPEIVVKEGEPIPPVAPEGTKVVRPGEVSIDTTPKPPVPPVDPNARPAWLDPKFKTPEDMAKAYKELETKQGAQAVPPAATLDAAKVDMPALAKEFADNGKLSEETLKALETKGISRAAVDAHIAGLKASAVAQRAELATVTGGEDNLKVLYEWAGTNLTDKEIAYFNDAVAAGNTDAAKLALHGMVSKYNDAMGKEPDLVNGENSRVGSTGVQPFVAQEQVVAAMRDPRYQTDASYRKQVEARLAVSFNGKASVTY